MVHRRSNIDDQTLGLVANLLEHRQLPDLDLSEPRWTHEKIAEACSVGRTTVRRVEENLCLFQQPKRPRLGPDKGTVSQVTDAVWDSLMEFLIGKPAADQQEC